MSDVVRYWKNSGRTTMRKLTLLLTILLLPSISAAGNDGNTLLLTCGEFIKGVDNPSDSNVDREQMYRCGSYLTGFIAASNLYQGLLGDKGLVCFPDKGISPVHLARIIMKHLEDRPESLDIDKDTLTGEVAMKAFPCK